MPFRWALYKLISL